MVVLCFLASCAKEGQELRTWRLDVNGGPYGVTVTLPGKIGELPNEEVDYTLTTEITLSPDQRGKQLTLVVDCFHAPLALRVDGTPIVERGDFAVGVSAFPFGPPLTDRPTLRL